VSEKKVGGDAGRRADRPFQEVDRHESARRLPVRAIVDQDALRNRDILQHAPTRVAQAPRHLAIILAGLGRRRLRFDGWRRDFLDRIGRADARLEHRDAGTSQFQRCLRRSPAGANLNRLRPGGREAGQVRPYDVGTRRERAELEAAVARRYRKCRCLAKHRDDDARNGRALIVFHDPEK